MILRGFDMNIRERYNRKTYGKPCPKCGSWDIVAQTPIKVDIDDNDLKNPKKLIGKWAKEVNRTGGILAGPCYLMCKNCGHKGPSVNCEGRTSTDVGRDPIVFSEMKRLWREQS